MPVLTAIDILGVQRYVFASNRLRDVVAASGLVDWAAAMEGALSEAGAPQVLLASGGNAILEFENLDRARGFIAKYTRLLHDKAPGLDVVIVHHDYANGDLALALDALPKKLARTKLERIPSSPQMGLSVTARCAVTGLPASGFDPLDSTQALSRTILRCRETDVRRRTKDRWQELLSGRKGLTFPDEIDQMGRSRGDTSLIGVVHVDGNGIGAYIADWLARIPEQQLSDAQVREQYRQWSAALDARVRDSLAAVIERVISSVDSEKQAMVGQVPELGFDLSTNNEQCLRLPIRPVLLGGDDLTFICDGRIALDLAETALAAFEGEIVHLGRISAAAGVALVANHAPFDRAYDLAEDLCAHAKRGRRKKQDTGCWLDWHVGTVRPGESVEDLRARQYRSEILHLTCRPYPLGTNTVAPETWRWLSRTVLGQGDTGFRGENWSGRRNKVKTLRELTREGEIAIRSSLEAWRTTAPGITLPSGVPNGGFFDATRTPLLDAIELLDIHLPLQGENAE